MFYVGQEVVCVDAGHPSDFRRWRGDIPEVGKKYTITRVKVVFDPLIDKNLIAIGLAEIKNSKTWDGLYAARRFRPLTKKSTDTGMAVLRKVADEASRGLERVD